MANPCALRAGLLALIGVPWASRAAAVLPAEDTGQAACRKFLAPPA